MDYAEIKKRVAGIAKEYPAALAQVQLEDVDRTVFHVQLAMDGLVGGLDSKAIVDVGGGLGLFSLACKAVGFGTVRLVDDFRDAVNDANSDALSLHRKHGIEVFSRDASSENLADIVAGSHVVTSFDSIEHWHRSPKTALHQMVNGLIPDGKLIVALPNCVNLRKRISVPLGYGKWSRMADWYERENFRGHVREPDVSDLRYMANDLDLQEVKILGRNWLGLQSRSPVIRGLTRILGLPLRAFPTLCSDLYLLGGKKAG